MTTFTRRPASPTEAAPRPVLPARDAIDWVSRVVELAPDFEGRAAAHDEADHFVADNYKALRAARFFSAGVPAALGGGGASFRELCDIVRTLAHSCGSTALSFSMHCHLVAATVWKWHHLNAPVGGLLKRIASEQLILVSTGGSDWLQSSGKAEAVTGGYRIHARKAFSSGCPAGDLLMTSVVQEDAAEGPTVLHFALPLNDPHVRIASTWRSMGMRGSGSHDLVIEEAFVPDSGIALRRPRGRWHPALHLVSKMALPLIYSTYVGLAEKARRIAINSVRERRGQVSVQLLAGEMENELFAAQVAHARMMELASHAEPGPHTTNAVLMARGLVEKAALNTVEKALELVGGRGFYRDFGLERIYRDVQAARFHPLAEKPRHLFSGRLALGLELDMET